MRRADKRFQIVGIPSGGGPSRKALRVTCARCGGHDDYTCSQRTPPPTEVITKWFEQRGWSIGRNSGRDICPECNAKDADERKKRKEARMTNPSLKDQSAKLGNIPVLGIVSDPPAAAPVVQPVQETPRPITRADRRRVMDFLDQVYPDPEKGYADGYSDKRVADEMNVPRLWVSTVREESYGPEIIVDWSDIERRQRELADDIKAKGEEMMRTYADLERRYATLNADISKLKKAVR